MAYGADKEKVRDVVLAAAKALPFTQPDTDSQKSQVWLVGFGDSSLNFELLVWPELQAVKRPNAMHAACAWAIDDARKPIYPVTPGGNRQREMAYRFGINILMYVLTGNYKADQVHLPAILERLGQ